MHEGTPKEMTQRYQVGACVGQGGLGSVFRTWDAQLGRWVALKRLSFDPSLGGTEVEENLRREATALAALQHPNVVTVHDFGIDEGGPFVVMEFIEGQTLEALIEQAPFDYESFLVLATQTLAGVGAAHRAGLLHRDLKPGNVMLAFAPDGTFQVKLLDFGLAKFAPVPMAQTMDQGNMLLGSIFFMAPEQFSRGVLDARTDLYALGCVFYYALTGQHPFDGDSVAEVMASHLQHRVFDLGPLRPDVPGPVAAWVTRLLSLAPADRPAGSAEASSALRALVSPAATTGVVVPAEPRAAHPVGGPAAGWLRRRSALALAVFCVLAAAGTYLFSRQMASRAPTPVPQSIRPEMPAANVHGKPLAEAPANTPPAIGSVPMPVSPGPAAPVPSVVLAASDITALRPHLGEMVDVRGTPAATGRTKSGTVIFLNFSSHPHEGLSLVFFVKPSSSTTAGPVRDTADLQRFVGQDLVVHGQLSDFKGDLQIVVQSLDQIRPAP